LNAKGKFISYFNESLAEGTFIKLTLGKYRGEKFDLEKIFITPVSLSEGIKLSFRYKFRKKEEFKNLSFDEGTVLAETLIGKEFFNASLFTVKNDISLEYNKKREDRIYLKKPTMESAEIKEHNREKSRFVDQDSKYLRLTGITNDKGKIKNDKYDKFRQIDKFVEITESLIKDSEIIDKQEIKVLDFGSGKSYLTFAMYDYIVNRLRKKCDIKGVESRKELVDMSNRFSDESGFMGLMFFKGTIIDFPPVKADIVTALHACDTATDDAIAKAIESGAEIIMLAPCCHKYVRKKISIPSNLKPVFKHGILEEHISSFITDGLRALALEAYGYKTKVFEFISPEHTSKNIMITALKKDNPPKLREGKINEINKLKEQFSLNDFYLDTIINLNL
jgi:hypothetical protein